MSRHCLHPKDGPGRYIGFKLDTNTPNRVRARFGDLRIKRTRIITLATARNVRKAKCSFRPSVDPMEQRVLRMATRDSANSAIPIWSRRRTEPWRKLPPQVAVPTLDPNAKKF
jgi:hypothetical protein